MKGYYNKDIFAKMTEVTEEMTVICRRCGNTWKEEVTHCGVISGFPRVYDYCDRCKEWVMNKQDLVNEINEFPDAIVL